jgi:type VI secretion system protein ImpA
MAAPPLLDFTGLTAPISEAAPSGVPLPFEVRETLTKGRVEENPDDFKPDDPMRPKTFKKAEWTAIAKLTQATLAKTSKDLLVAARLTEALVKLHGFAGLRDSLHLMRLMIEQCWDRLHPVIEDGDLDVRAGPFNWLDDSDHGARFPNTLRMAPIIFFGETGQYSWLDSKQSQEGKGKVARDEFEKGVSAMTYPRCEAVATDIAQCREELNLLTQALAVKMGPSAPGLTSIRQAVEECHTLIQEILQRKRPPDEAKPDTPGEIPATGAAPSARNVASRAEAYRQISRAASVLKELEPHSPIPYLIQRAVELGSMPFPELIKELVRDPKIILELNRELGIREGATPPAKK